MGKADKIDVGKLTGETIDMMCQPIWI